MIEEDAMKRMTGILVLATTLAGCRPEPQPPADAGQVLAAGLPGARASAAEQDSSPMVVRRLWFYSDNLGFWGGPSLDGRYLTYVDPMTDGLALHEFSTGENRPLTDASSYAWASAFSPDGERVAYSQTNETGVVLRRRADRCEDGRKRRDQAQDRTGHCGRRLNAGA
jgi:hypothetical protein